ncbi:MAG: ABC-2 family transporter protein [Planctomycetia bacterium]|nr:ABC-2 family transporter protein [Planctomycetia bacterium]
MTENVRLKRPHYGRVFATFFRNSLVREMAFRGNFLIEIVTNAFWFAAQLVFFAIIFGNVQSMNGWTRYEYFAFMATNMIVNTVMEAFFMPNCANFSELIRTGNLDFALLKPIDTQFLISFEKLDLGALFHLLLPVSLLGYSLHQLEWPIDPPAVAAYLVLVALGIAFFYSLMIMLASTSVWLGRNQGLYEFWFYITVFARYPRNIYGGSPAGAVLQFVFSYLIPILLVITVPAEVVVGKPLGTSPIMLVTAAAAIVGLFVSRRVFYFALKSYRSASS